LEFDTNIEVDLIQALIRNGSNYITESIILKRGSITPLINYFLVWPETHLFQNLYQEERCLIIPTPICKIYSVKSQRDVKSIYQMGRRTPFSFSTGMTQTTFSMSISQDLARQPYIIEVQNILYLKTPSNVIDLYKDDIYKHMMTGETHANL